MVLVLDDEPGVGLVWQETLGRYGYHLTFTDNSVDALTHLSTRPDVVAVSADMRSAGMSGLQFGVQLLRPFPGIPVLFLISSPAPVGLLDNPFIGLINKPMRIADVRSRLDELLQRAAHHPFTRENRAQAVPTFPDDARTATHDADSVGPGVQDRWIGWHGGRQ